MTDNVGLRIKDGYIILPTGERVARLGDDSVYFWSRSLKREVPIPFNKFLEVLVKGLYGQAQQQGRVFC